MKSAGGRKSSGRVTLRDIAKDAGVTAATVSDILNERERCWASKETKERVRAVADRLGYRVNRAARLLRTGNSGLMGIIISDILNPFYVSLAHSLEVSLEAAGYEVVIEDCGGDPAREERAIRNLLALSVDGMVCATLFRKRTSPRSGNTASRDAASCLSERTPSSSTSARSGLTMTRRLRTWLSCCANWVTSGLPLSRLSGLP